ncbi:MAG: hypothetical protein WAU78_06050 [Roseiarcus sp.]|jgi:hypothetical protein
MRTVTVTAVTALGDAAFLAALEGAAQRRLCPMPRGPKPKERG